MVVVSKFMGRWALWALASVGRLTPVHGHSTQDGGNASLPEQINATNVGYVPDIVPQPFYAIANKVITKEGVMNAVLIGANALRIPVTGWTVTGWWADYDGKARSAGDSVHKMFEYIAGLRTLGRNIGLVWLDVRNPDFCTTFYPRCSFTRLRDLARDILQSEGIYVLYGFSLTTVNGSAYATMQHDINDMEALSIDGGTREIKALFEKYGPKSVDSRVMSYGDYDLANRRFGHCDEERFYTCAELKKGVNSRDDWGKTYAWTASGNQAVYVDRLMDAGVDGLVFGFKALPFAWNDATRAAFQDIEDWIDTHPYRYLATTFDKPWSRRPKNDTENK